MPSLIETLSRPVKNLLADRPEKLRRRTEKLKILESLRAEWKLKIDSAEEERNILSEILSGDRVKTIRRLAAREIEPLQAEVGALTKEIASNPPDCVRRLERELEN